MSTQSESYSQNVPHPSIGQSFQKKKNKEKKAFVHSIENLVCLFFIVLFALMTMTPLEKMVGTKKQSHNQWCSDTWQVTQPGCSLNRWVEG